jgi:hypothetical protein
MRQRWLAAMSDKNKPTGLLYSEVKSGDMAETERKRREARFNKWLNDNQPVIALLETFPNEELVLYLCKLIYEDSKSTTAKKLLLDVVAKSVKGRQASGKSMQQKADAHKNNIKPVLIELLKNPKKSGMTDGEIANYLMHSKRELHIHNGKSRTKKTMMRYIKQIRDEFEPESQ